MILKLKDKKHKNGKIVAEVLIKDKDVIRTKSLDSETVANGKHLNSNHRTSYTL